MRVNAPRLLRSALISVFALVAVIGVVGYSVTAATYTANLSTAVNWTATTSAGGSAAWVCAPTTAAGDSCGFYPGQLTLPGGIIDQANITSSGGVGPVQVTTLIPNPIHLNINGAGADVGAGGQLTLTGSSLVTFLTGVPTLSISGGTLTNGGTLALTSSGLGAFLNLNGGTLNGAGTTTIGNGATFNMTGTQGAMAIDQQTINSAGTLGFTAGNTLTMSNGANMTNAAGGTFNANGTGVITQGAGSALLTNQGSMFKSAGANFTIDVPFVNTGTAATSSIGVGMSFTRGSGPGGHNSPAAWSLGGPGNTMAFGGAHGFSGAETFSGTGTITVNPGASWSLNTSPILGTGLNLTNNGAISFSTSANTLTVAGGSFAQSASGVYQPTLGPTSGTSNSVNITGAATLGGTLAPILAGTYTPAVGDTFTVMRFTSSTGAFTYTPITFPGGSFQLTNTGTAIQLAAVAAQDIAVTKTGPAVVNNGQTATYTVTVTNNGPLAATATISDTFTSGFVTAPPAGCTNTSSTSPITCTTGSLALGGSQTFTVNIVTNAIGTFTNTAALVSSSPPDTSTNPNNTQTVTTTVNPAADLQVSNPFSGPASVNAGAAAVYTATLNNSGPDAAASPAFNFTLTGGGTITGGSATGFACTPAGTTMSCTAAALAAGSPVTFTINVTAPNNPAGSMTLSGTASSPTFDSNAANNTGSITTAVTPVSDIQVTKSGPVTVTGGTNVVYTIVVTNNGPSDAATVTVTDTPGAGLTFVSNTGGCAGGFPCTLALTSGQSVTLTSTYALSSTVTTGTVTNTAGATSPNSDSNPGNNSASVTSTVSASSDIGVTKAGPATVTGGTNVVYTITVRNFGPSDAPTVTVTDTPGAGLTFVSNSGGCTTAFPCTLALTSGQQTTITSTWALSSTVTSGTVTNTVNASSPNSDSTPANNTAAANAAAVASADVTVSKTGPATAASGQSISYTMVVTNNGPSSAAGVSLDDPAQPGLTFTGFSSGPCASFPCALGAIPNGGSVIVVANYTVTAAPGSVSNTATVSAASPDPNPGNNSSTVVTTVTVPLSADLSITKSGPITLFGGSTVTFNIVVTNLGPGTATNVVVDDVPSSGLTFLSASGACSSFPCTIASMASGATANIAATYKVSATATSVTNTARVASSTPDPNPANNSVTITRSVRPQCPSAAPVQIVPSAGDPNVPVNGTIQWTNVGASNYDVYLGPAGTGCSTLAGSVAGTSFSYSNLAPNTDYESRIVASSPNCPTPAPLSSACVKFHTANGPCNLPSPTITAPLPNTSAVSPEQLQWTPVPGATSYHVVVMVNGELVVDQSTSDPFLNVSLPTGSVTWSVSAVSPTCTSAASTSTFQSCNAPAAPLAGVPGAVSSGHQYAVIVVDPRPDTSQYEYQEATNPQFTDATTQTSTSVLLPYIHTVGTTPQVFYYRVRGFSSCANKFSPYSKVMRTVILPTTASTHPQLNVPAGTKDPVVIQVFIPGQSQNAAFSATFDKPWVIKIVPSSGTLTPSGETLQVFVDPAQLHDGTFTATVLVTTTPLTTESGHKESNGNTTTSTPVSINIVTPVVPVDPSAPGVGTLVVPAVGHLVGLDSQWRSDVRVFNNTQQLLSYNLNFISSVEGDVKQTTIDTAPGDTTALDDIIHNWYGVGEVADSATGVLVVTPLEQGGGGPPSLLDTIVSSRTYNLSSIGTLGQFIPAIPLSNFVPAGTALSLQQIAQTDNFRTNFGLVEASGAPAHVVLSMFRSDGTKLFDVPVDLGAGEQKQLNGLLTQQGVTSLSDGRMQVQVTSGDGKVTAYASVVDNRSGDPLFVPGARLDHIIASPLYVVPGVADLNNTSASWRTDMRIFNSDTTAQTATLTFFPEGEGHAPLTTSVTVNPGEVKVLDNILQSSFAAQNVGGAIHVATAGGSQLVVTARTYNQTASGTLGQFIPAATLDDSIAAGGRALNILQVEDSVRYRTNVGLAEMSGKAATVEISVNLPDSKVTPAIQLTLAPNEFLQFPLSSFSLGNVYNVRVAVRVIDGGGHVTAYGSVIDQATTAPTYVAAQ